MLKGQDRQTHYHNVTQDWKNEVAIKQLDQISQLIDGCQSSNWILLILFPIPLITYLRLQYLTSQNAMLKEFKGTFVFGSLFVMISSISYIFSLKYISPVAAHFWDFFHQNIDLEELGYNLWQFPTVQAVIACLLHLGFSGLACESFKVLPIFQERYEELKNMRFAWQANTQAEITIKARMIEELPDIVNEAIKAQMNVVMTALALDPEQAKKLQNLMPKLIKEIIGSTIQPLELSQTTKEIQAEAESEYDD